MNHLARIVFSLLAITSAVLLVEAFRDYQAKQTFNDAIVQGDYANAGAVDIPQGRFAQAYLAHQNNEYQAARLLYDELTDRDKGQLSQDALFNQANTYLQQALATDLDEQADIAVPLIELAKLTYRELLAVSPTHQAAKYNLEIALQLSPDDRGLPPLEIPGRRDPNRTIISIDPEDSLP